MPERTPQADHFVLLHLPSALYRQLWQGAQHAAPQECVGLLGGQKQSGQWYATHLWVLRNVAQHPEIAYQADPQQTWQALKDMQSRGLELVALYHSHPRGPAHYSAQDKAQAAYDVPHLIADLSGGKLLAYWLPSGEVAAWQLTD